MFRWVRHIRAASEGYRAPWWAKAIVWAPSLTVIALWVLYFTFWGMR